MKAKFFAILCALIPIFSLQATAEKPSLLSFGVGIFDVCKDNRVAMFQLEYKSGSDLRNWRPLIGAFMNTDKGVYIYGGIGYDIFIGRQKKIVITPSFAPGYYWRGGGKRLGFPLEFRSCLEVAYQMKHKGRLGAEFYHISNASIGYKNPGAEALVFFYSLPLQGWGHRKTK